MSSHNNNQKPITWEDLGNFTEEVLLPALDRMMDEKLDSKLDEKLDSKLDEKLKPIYEELSFLRSQVFQVNERLEEVEKRLKKMEERLD